MVLDHGRVLLLQGTKSAVLDAEQTLRAIAEFSKLNPDTLSNPPATLQQLQSPFKEIFTTNMPELYFVYVIRLGDLSAAVLGKKEYLTRLLDKYHLHVVYVDFDQAGPFPSCKAGI